MPVSVIVGGQHGSEGKGKVCHWHAKNNSNVTCAVRCGGPNAGHTIIHEGQKMVFQQIPASVVFPGVIGVISAGSYISEKHIKQEVRMLVEAGIMDENGRKVTTENGISTDSSKLLIDPFAMIITDEMKQAERDQLTDSIGSTASGTGFAAMTRISRDPSVKFAKDIDYLKPYIGDAPKFMRSVLDRGERIQIEGTQGFGLDLLHSGGYPFTTSRVTTAAGFVAECGLSPMDVDEIIMTLRAFPIRVAGNSGPLKNEIDWAEVSETRNMGIADEEDEKDIVEKTTVTKKVRRVAEFDAELVKRAILLNQPTSLVMNHMDYFGNPKTPEGFQKVINFLTRAESNIGRGIDFLGFDEEGLVAKKEFVAA